jgi:hypothetical protein
VSKVTKESKVLKSKKLRNILICSAPLLSFIFIQPEWLARLLAVSGFFMLVNILLLIYGLNPKNGLSIAQPPTGRKEIEKEKRDRYAPRVVKVLAILSGILILWFLTIPTARDCMGAIQKGRSYLTEIEGKVLNNQGIFGTRSVMQSFTIVEKGNTSGNSYSAVFFRRIAHEGETYHFLVAPKSALVLDWTND